jgi:hypothetical protein
MYEGLPRCYDFQHILDLIFQDDSRNVHAGDREVRPPPAPTGIPAT